MGAVKVHEFTTVDGVVDAPSWTMDYGFPDDLGAAVGELTAGSSGILLGRRTFEMFAPAWSTRTAEEDPGAPFFNDTLKHVVSATLTDPAALWPRSTSLGGYDPERLRALKQAEDGDLYVSGSATLVRAMLADGLVDELHLFVYPLAVGTGLRLFPDGAPRTPLRLLSQTGFRRRRAPGVRAGLSAGGRRAGGAPLATIMELLPARHAQRPGTNSMIALRTGYRSCSMRREPCVVKCSPVWVVSWPRAAR